MAESVDNLVLEQSRLIREDIRQFKSDMTIQIKAVETKVGELSMRMQSVEGVMFGLGGYIRSIDERVEHIETKLGIPT